MKLILVIVSDRDADSALTALVEDDFRVTRVASTGGFLRRGSTTLLIGTEEERVDRALQTIREACEEPQIPGQGRAIVFVLNVAHFETF